MNVIDVIKSINNPAILIREHDDGTYECVFASDGFVKLMEYSSADEAMEKSSGNGFILSTHPEDRIFVRRLLRRKKNEDGTSELTIRKLTNAGRQIWCNACYSFIDDIDGAYIYITYNDATVQKEYEQRLGNAYISLGDTFYKAGDRTLGMFRVNLSRDSIEDIQGKDLFATDSILRPYSEVMEQRLIHYPIKEERESFFNKFNKDALIEKYLSGQMHESEILYSVRTDGRHSFVNLTANMTRHPMTGDVIAFIAEETSNIEKVDQMLLSNILVRQFDMVSYLSNGRYGVVIGDSALIEKGSIFPLSRKGIYNEYLETQVFPVLHGTDEEKSRQEKSLRLETIEEELEKKEPYIVNIAIDIAGETYYKRFDFYRTNPEARFYIVLKSDITDIQKEQMQINEQLNVALDEARQASIAKTVFLSQMSHEIRTPMNAIIGLDNIALQEEKISDSTRENLEKIGGSARHLLSLINDILDMSRIESGRMTLKKEEFSFRGIIDQVNTIIDGQCRDKGLHYECVFHGSLDEFYIGDDTKLRQVLINILGNSVKFTDEGGKVSLSVECKARYGDQSTIKFVMADTGIGMDKEYLPKIFEAFSQEDATATNKYGGSGLGLAITKNIVEMMNGTVTVESQKGVGSTFTVEIPLQNTDKKLSIDYDVRPQDLHILIIDDDPIACQHAHIALEEIGIESDTCLSGKEALELIKLGEARCTPYNLILVDLKMPDRDGVEVTKDIREEIGNDAAIVILTAYSWTDVEDEARRVGVDAFMSKPIFASTVLFEFQQAIQKKKIKNDSNMELTDLTGKRILLAEDMLINAEIMKKLLGMKKMEVEHAENGQIAFDLVRNNPDNYFDAILMDVRMPVMDGLSATKAIREIASDYAQNVPIIAMTANAFDEDVQRSLQAGMNAHLAKPVEPEHLYRTLGELIK